MAFSWATLTASVSAMPAARLVICLVLSAVPTDTAPFPDFHAGPVSVDASPVRGSYPKAPAAVLATDSVPKATPPSTLTLASLPRMVTLDASVFAFFVREPMIIFPSTSFNSWLSPMMRLWLESPRVFLFPVTILYDDLGLSFELEISLLTPETRV